jgi:hypothetical protein
MGRSLETRNGAVEAALVDFMTEFARHLIAAGISNTRFSGVARAAYFAAATDQARFSNDRLNQSAVAAMTGLTRSQVRRYAKQTLPTAPNSRDRLEVLLDGWSTDSSFTTSDFSPRKLRLGGAGVTFGSLVQRYGGDIPPRSMLRELQRHGYVTLRNGVVSLNRKVSRTRAEIRLARFSRVLTELLSSRRDPQVTTHSPLRAVVLETTYPTTSNKGKSLLQRRLSENLVTFLSGIQAVGVAASLEAPPSRAQKGKLTRTRIALISEDEG